MNLCLLRGVQSALTPQTRARCKEIPTRTTIKIAAGPGCSYRSPAGRDERRGRRAPGPGFEKSSAVVTQGGRSFGPHSSCYKENDRRHAGRTCRSVFSTSTNAKRPYVDRLGADPAGSRPNLFLFKQTTPCRDEQGVILSRSAPPCWPAARRR